VLAEIQEAQGNYQSALTSFKKFKQLHDAVINEETGTNINLLEARFEAEQRTKEIALLKKDNEIQTLEVDRQKLLRNIWGFGTVGAALFIGLVIFIQNRRTQQKKLERKVKERTQALVEIQAQMVDTAHRAGMAEIAIDILHNVGNSLNSVHASAGMLLENLHNTKPLKILDGIVGLIEKQEASLAHFLASDKRGKAIPGALKKVNHGLQKKQDQLVNEVVQLKRGLNEVNDLIKAQGQYAQVADSGEEIDITVLLERELQKWDDDMARHDIVVIKDFAPLPKVFSQKYKFARIIQNLLENATKALKDHDPVGQRQITIKTGVLNKRWLRVEIQDNGVGISKSDMGQIFNQGFTTDKNAKGIGLHFCANAVTALYGDIHANSEGPGCGARFVLDIPNSPIPEFDTPDTAG